MTRKVTSALTVVVAAATVTVGCEPFDGARSATARPGLADASVDARVPISEAGPSGDSGSRCSTGGSVVFCADFEGSVPGAEWSAEKRTSEGAIEVDSASPLSGGGASMKLVLAPGPKDTGVRLFVNFPGWQRTRLSFEARIAFREWDATYPVNSRATLAAFLLTEDGPGAQTLQAVFGSAKLELNAQHPGAGGFTSKEASAMSRLLDRWTQYVLEVDPGLGEGALTIDGTTTRHTGLAYASPATPQMRAFIGIARYNGGSPLITVHFDNVKIERF